MPGPHVASRRGRVLAALFALLLPAFALTALATRSYRSEQQQLAAEAFARGEATLLAGRPDEAVDAFRTALSLSRERAHRLRLAQALAAAGRSAEARAHLLTLRERSPGDGTINLDLARIAARSGDIAQAARYYRDAVEGAWDTTPERRRRDVRLELATFLVQSGAAALGHAELIALAADLPDDATLHVRVADLLMRAGDPQRAFDLYRSAVRLEPRSPAALAGAAEAAFRLTNYLTARRYFAAALDVRPDDKALEARVEVVGAVLALDPFRRGLSSRERARRAIASWRSATERLTACAAFQGVVLDVTPPSDELQRIAQEARSVEDRVRLARLVHDTDLLDTTMDVVFRIQETAAQRCGEPQGVDLAVLLIGRDRRAAER